jgi:hypothetical protein
MTADVLWILFPLPISLIRHSLLDAFIRTSFQINITPVFFRSYSSTLSFIVGKELLFRASSIRIREKPLHLRLYLRREEIPLYSGNAFRWLSRNYINSYYSAVRFGSLYCNLHSSSTLHLRLHLHQYSGHPNVIELTRSTTVCPFRNNLYFASIYGAQIKSGATFICPSKRKHTSRSLKAALLFNPWTLASRANESLPCLLFHLVEDEDVAVLREIRGIGRTSMQLNCCGKNSLPRCPLLNAFKACRESM